MKFIQIGYSGRNGFLNYFATFALTASTLLGVGLIPYTYALKKVGLVLNKGISTEDAINALGENTFLALQLFPFVLALFVLMLCNKFIHKRTVLSLFTSRKSFDWKRFFVSFTAWGILMFCMLGINAHFLKNPYEWNFNSQTFWMLLAISIFVIPLQTTFEEAFFRGNLFQGMGTFFRKGWVTVFFTASLFALIHGSNPEVETLGFGILIYFLVTGVFLGILTLMDDGLELSMGFHAWNNIFGALFVTNNWQVFQSDAIWMDTAKPNFGWDAIASMAVFFPLLILLFSKLFNWKDWKNRFFGEIKDPNQHKN